MENRILLKARELVVRNGARYVTMDVLANELGISKKTIYQFFEDKDALISAVIEFELGEQSLRCTKSLEQAENAVHEMFMLLEDIQTLFRNMNPLTITELAKYHVDAFMKIEHHKNVFMHGVIISNLKRGIEQGVYRKDIDPEILAAYRLETGFIAFNPNVFPLNKHDIGKVNVQIMEHFIYGVMSPKGIELMEKYKQEKSAAKESGLDEEFINRITSKQ
jgi:TetR/AcrR family transcriptional regulator, cholesterol catabolism regulator